MTVAPCGKQRVTVCRAALAGLLAVLCALLVFVPVAHAAVWTTLPGDRIFPSTPPGSQQSISVALAGGEYQGAIIGLQGTLPRVASVSWSADSDPFLIANSVLDQVAFVDIAQPTTGTGAKPGLYRDPLLPRSFGEALSVPAQSSSLYVLFHVPYGTPAGIYSGSLLAANGAETVTLPVTLRVWSFGWQRLSVQAAFMTEFRRLGSPATATEMLLAHGVTPLMPPVAPAVAPDGSFNEARYLAKLSPYLASGGLDLPITRLPWIGWCPSQPWRFQAYSQPLLAYLTALARLYAANGWQAKAIAYPLDEPTTTAAEHDADALARTLHTASADAGFRCKFLLTDDPRPTSLGSLPANTFLWNDVDIWCVRYRYFFGRVPILRRLQARGAEVWFYPYYNSEVNELPNFVIEKSLADERVFGWLMYAWNVDGMLYWDVDRWGNARTGAGDRDPYQDPLSFSYPDGQVANGEGSLIYPGYYPPYGLNDPNAAPVSSLRLEALRDGFEDLEYLKLATKLLGASFVRSIVGEISWYPYPVRYGAVNKFPKYVTAPAAFAAARQKLALAIEEALAVQARPLSSFGPLQPPPPPAG